VFAIVVVALLYIFGGFITMLAWNAFMPAVFGLTSINWGQGIALSWLLAQVAGFTGKTATSATSTLNK
jgi:hypothetical protein